MAAEIPSDAYVIIIGAMKSATTSLFDMLAQHPAVCTPIRNKKEPEFFSEHQHHAIKEITRYEEVFDFHPDTHMRCLEASTGYTKFPEEIDVARRMKKYGIDPLFIYSVRSPIDRIASEYNWTHIQHKRLARRNFLNPGALYRSMYYIQLREYIKVYPNRERYFIVDFDDIVSQPKKLASRLFEWIGLEEYNIRSISPSNVTQSPSQIEKRFSESRLSWSRIVPKSLKKHARRLLRRFDASAKQTMSDSERRDAHRLLRRDMQRFGAYFDFPIEKWGFRRP